LEGRIQRALILYKERLQIPDPMNFFEEIMRHRLRQGIIPLENFYSARALDAPITAYVAWGIVKHPSQIELSPKNFALLKPMEG